MSPQPPRPWRHRAPATGSGETQIHGTEVVKLVWFDDVWIFDVFHLLHMETEEGLARCDLVVSSLLAGAASWNRVFWRSEVKEIVSAKHLLEVHILLPAIVLKSCDMLWWLRPWKAHRGTKVERFVENYIWDWTKSGTPEKCLDSCCPWQNLGVPWILLGLKFCLRPTSFSSSTHCVDALRCALSKAEHNGYCHNSSARVWKWKNYPNWRHGINPIPILSIWMKRNQGRDFRFPLDFCLRKAVRIRPTLCHYLVVLWRFCPASEWQCNQRNLWLLCYTFWWRQESNRIQ
jgi:hypothetical protein